MHPANSMNVPHQHLQFVSSEQCEVQNPEQQQQQVPTPSTAYNKTDHQKRQPTSVTEVPVPHQKTPSPQEQHYYNSAFVPTPGQVVSPPNIGCYSLISYIDLANGNILQQQSNLVLPWQCQQAQSPEQVSVKEVPAPQQKMPFLQDVKRRKIEYVKEGQLPSHCGVRVPFNHKELVTILPGTDILSRKQQAPPPHPVHMEKKRKIENVKEGHLPSHCGLRVHSNHKSLVAVLPGTDTLTQQHQAPPPQPVHMEKRRKIEYVKEGHLQSHCGVRVHSIHKPLVAILPGTDVPVQKQQAPPPQPVHMICPSFLYRGLMLKERYEIVCTIGEGVFGQVLECVDHLKGGIRVAVKIIKEKKGVTRSCHIREVRIMHLIDTLDSEKKFALVRMLDWFDHYGKICIVYELLGSSTFEFLSRNRLRPFTIDQIRHMADQIFKAINFLHQNKIAHTDLKPDNILFVTDEGIQYDAELKHYMRALNSLDVKVADFGCAVHTVQYCTGQVTAQFYRAPEVTLNLEWNEACDVWSLGCILFEYYVGRPLFKVFDKVNHLSLMQRVLGPLPVHMLQKSGEQENIAHARQTTNPGTSSSTHVGGERLPLQEYMLSRSTDHVQLFDLIRKMLEYDASKRITLEEAVKHPFFTLENNQLENVL